LSHPGPCSHLNLNDMQKYLLCVPHHSNRSRFWNFGMCRNSNVISVISLKIGDVIVKQITCSEILPTYTKVISQKHLRIASTVCNNFLVLTLGTTSIDTMFTIHRCCKRWLYDYCPIPLNWCHACKKRITSSLFIKRRFKHSTNINYANKHLPPQFIEHTKTWHMVLAIQVLAWDKHKNVAGLNQLMRLQPPFWQLDLHSVMLFLLYRSFVTI